MTEGKIINSSKRKEILDREAIIENEDTINKAFGNIRQVFIETKKNPL